MDIATFEAKGIRISVDLAVGHLADFVIETQGRKLKPLHRAPWADGPPELLPAHLPEGVRRLSGDFLCAPFSRSDVEEAPLHGWPANSAWEVADSTAVDKGRRMLFRLKRKVMGATVEKILTLRDHHPFLYQEHVFLGGSGAISVAHHTMTQMGAGGHLAFSPKRLAATPEQAPETDPARGRSLLTYPARATNLQQFPTADGTFTDLTEYRANGRHEDFVTLLEADHDGPGWAAVARQAEADLVLVLKNPAQLPVTMLWISNGGRDYAPWNGRGGVIGIEDGRAAIGHAASLGDNWLKREGVSTAFALGGRISFRQIIGALPLDGFGLPRHIDTASGLLRISADQGSPRQVPFDDQFLWSA
ncbi:hypothetical protein ASD50_15710 [Mesorhizobium sp. Root552]|uniref:hypothetical protein n=1 Tax=Mesorhizobium sp. Root552 TaxID=1736555 RepID=UPI0006FDABE5|nr:hypothetical protein [Mesorhizobium sp. Root552]KQZ31292.1 hypothetical protein ASD50_15710 [Mesorhizobium sp. Root552]